MGDGAWPGFFACCRAEKAGLSPAGSSGRAVKHFAEMNSRNRLRVSDYLASILAREKFESFRVRGKLLCPTACRERNLDVTSMSLRIEGRHKQRVAFVFEHSGQEGAFAKRSTGRNLLRRNIDCLPTELLQKGYGRSVRYEGNPRP
jgi:hypothetical protein